MRRTSMLLFSAAVLTAMSARAADTDDPSRAVYLRYCGACHGPGGKGDGIAGGFMRKRPTDLTQLAKQNGGSFPFLRTMETIDGRNTLRAHGDPDMPVWGEIFADRSTWEIGRRAEVRGKLMVLTDYVRTIQEK